MKKTLLIVLSSFFFSQCFYKDYRYKESLANSFYLMESDILPSKYVCLEHDDSRLVLIDEVVEIFGNDEEILIKTKNDKNQITFNLIKTNVVQYPEDIITLSYQEFKNKKSKIKYEYSYDEKNGLERFFKGK